VMAQNGVPIGFISQVLNHSNSEITRVYARMHRDNQRDALAVSSEVLDGVFEAIGRVLFMPSVCSAPLRPATQDAQNIRTPALSKLVASFNCMAT